MADPMPARKEEYTYADVLTWKGEHWELIDGIPFDMTPAPSYQHQVIIGAIYRQFFPYLDAKTCEIILAPFDIRLPKADEDAFSASTVVQPDLTLMCDPEKFDQHGYVGAPTMVIEVLSPMTATHDLREKRKAYERAGVKEYWVVSPTDQVVQVFLLDAKGRYGVPVIYGNGEQIPVQVLEGLVIDLARVFAYRRK